MGVTVARRPAPRSPAPRPRALSAEATARNLDLQAVATLDLPCAPMLHDAIHTPPAIRALAAAAALVLTTAVAARAATFTGGVETGLVAASGISEASGIAASRGRPGLLWVHNDSGHSARVYAIESDGTATAEYELLGVRAIDYEDIAVGPGPDRGANYIYLGDIGDNFANRPHVVVHRFREPDASVTSGEIKAEDIGILELVYPDGAHDAEALLSDPLTGDLFVITKSVEGKSGVFRAPFPQSERTRNMMERVSTVTFVGQDASDLAVTAADISIRGDEILIRTYNKAGLWSRAPGESVAAALAGEPEPVPVPGPPAEPQGEAIGFSSDASSYYTLGEGVAQPLYRFDRISPGP